MLDYELEARTAFLELLQQELIGAEVYVMGDADHSFDKYEKDIAKGNKIPTLFSVGIAPMVESATHRHMQETKLRVGVATLMRDDPQRDLVMAEFSKLRTLVYHPKFLEMMSTACESLEWCEVKLTGADDVDYEDLEFNLYFIEFDIVVNVQLPVLI